MAEKSTDPWAVWKPCEGDQGTAALTRLARELPAYFADATLLSSRSSTLAFYKTYRLMELQLVRDDGTERAFVLDGPGGTAWLNGDSGPMHSTNEAESMALTDATVADYVRFFFYFVRADEGAFVLLESSAEVASANHADDTKNPDKEDDEPGLSLQTVQDAAHPLLMRGLDPEGRWLVDAVVAYGESLFTTTVAVEADGSIEMIDDNQVGLLTGLEVAAAPSLKIKGRTGDSSDGATIDLEPSHDREVTKAVIAVLLEDAIRERNADPRAGKALLHHFNSQTRADKPIEQLARLVAASKAMMIIESDIPFVEEVVGQLIAPVGDNQIARASAVAGDDLRCEIAVNEWIKLFLLSFHVSRGLADAERAAHDLTLSDAAVLIGCSRATEVPEPLRRAADLVVRFPRIDRRRFARIFQSVFNVPPTAGWDAEGTDWTQYLVPGDFHTPRRLSLSPDDALSMLRDRVEARLSQVTPEGERGLGKLYGLGEARQIAQDLLEDIRAAQADQIPWSAVDKGFLLVGAPGTGKTSLARAIAQESAVKFINASAASWQSAGALDAHLRTMRSDFAEARRYAPAILFIDEIDSIGNRELLEGPNAIYQTEVINALLAEIQGIDSTGSVIVIAATNYEDKVDPALRRAGRLDQVVQIPLPNIEGLEQIFGYYLSRYRNAGGEQAPDIDTHALAQMAFGLTGADVEFFLRGGARRARRDNRPLSQADLMAEVTRRPRRPESAPRLSTAEMHRVAVHEAGHTVARLISSTRGEDLAFTSIVPRLNGSLGFTASVPPNTRVMTRHTMLEQLQTLLAGRAAEEIVFGADDIGAGSGGSSLSSDLAVATHLATLIVCQSGLGGDGLLRWTSVPTADQDDKIDDVIGEAYRSIRTSLQACRLLLDRVAAALEDKQELSGNELRKLAESLDQNSRHTE